jgi:hypothetical protein
MFLHKKIVICGGMRDGMTHLSNLFENLSFIQTYFERSHIIIFENDSQDGTGNILEDLKREEPYYEAHLTLLRETGVDARFPLRTHRLAYIRNRLVEHALQYHSDADYLLMMDMDEVNSATPDFYETFPKIFQYENAIWDVQTISQKKHYYDIWALRKRGLIEFDCWEEFTRSFAEGTSRSREEAHQNFIGRFQTPYPAQRGLIPVISAFGGAGIYQMDLLRRAFPTASYVGFSPQNKYNQETCEHVSFHESLTYKFGGRIFINPEWINQD